jgi:tetratricopeptide (TPR) repeat protein
LDLILTRRRELKERDRARIQEENEREERRRQEALERERRAEERRKKDELERQERERQEAEEAEASKEFLELKMRFDARSDSDPSPSNPLFVILKRIDAQEPLQEGEDEYLKKVSEYAVLAAYFEQQYESTMQPWMTIRACGFLRDAGQPERAVQLADTVFQLARQTYLSAREIAAAWTTRGAAMADINEIDTAETCACNALEAQPRSFYPHNLLGRIYFHRGDFVTGEQYFETARVLGSPEREVRRSMQSALQRSAVLDRKAAAKYLLDKDSEKYTWAKRYL